MRFLCLIVGKIKAVSWFSLPMLLIMTNNFIAWKKERKKTRDLPNWMRLAQNHRVNSFQRIKIGNCNNLINIFDSLKIWWKKRTKDVVAVKKKDFRFYGNSEKCSQFVWNPIKFVSMRKFQTELEKLNHKSRDISNMLYFRLYFDMRATYKCQFFLIYFVRYDSLCFNLPLSFSLSTSVVPFSTLFRWNERYLVFRSSNS